MLTARTRASSYRVGSVLNSGSCSRPASRRSARRQPGRSTGRGSSRTPEDLCWSDAAGFTAGVASTDGRARLVTGAGLPAVRGQPEEPASSGAAQPRRGKASRTCRSRCRPASPRLFQPGTPTSQRGPPGRSASRNGSEPARSTPARGAAGSEVEHRLVKMNQNNDVRTTRCYRGHRGSRTRQPVQLVLDRCGALRGGLKESKIQHRAGAGPTRGTGENHRHPSSHPPPAARSVARKKPVPRVLRRCRNGVYMSRRHAMKASGTPPTERPAVLTRIKTASRAVIR